LALLLFIATFAMSRIVSLSSLVATVVTPLFLFLLAYPTGHFYAGLVIAALITVRHHENIIRLLKGQEEKFSSAKSSSPAA
jgi:glycerol-3-phosphate acyltransferase PlsY